MFGDGEGRSAVSGCGSEGRSAGSVLAFMSFDLKPSGGGPRAATERIGVNLLHGVVLSKLLFLNFE